MILIFSIECHDDAINVMTFYTLNALWRAAMTLAAMSVMLLHTPKEFCFLTLLQHDVMTLFTNIFLLS